MSDLSTIESDEDEHTGFAYWNYRVVKTVTTFRIGDKDHVDTTFDIHEVYYDLDDKITAWSQEAIAAQGNDEAELRSDIASQLSAFTRPVLLKEDLPS